MNAVKYLSLAVSAGQNGQVDTTTTLLPVAT